MTVPSVLLGLSQGNGLTRSYWKMVSGRSLGLCGSWTTNPQEYVHTSALLSNMATLRSIIIEVHFNDIILVDSACSPSKWINSNATS
jgi:hypothetical protein